MNELKTPIGRTKIYEQIEEKACVIKTEITGALLLLKKLKKDNSEKRHELKSNLEGCLKACEINLNKIKSMLFTEII